LGEGVPFRKGGVDDRKSSIFNISAVFSSKKQFNFIGGKSPSDREGIKADGFL